jgi:hypothetical protein
MVQLPAVNTPQFNWCRTRLPNHPQPVPPIFQPEVPARAIYYAARHRRREIYCGMPVLQAIIGTKLVPGLADRYLARTGFDSQQVQGEPVDSDRPDNLFEPVSGEAGTRGSFDDQAKRRSVQLWATTHRPVVAAAAAAALGAGIAYLRR